MLFFDMIAIIIQENSVAAMLKFYVNVLYLVIML